MVTPVKSFVVHAATTDEKTEWMVDICNAVEEWKARSATLAKESKVAERGSSFEAPVWVPDDQVTECSLCYDKFGLIKRRVCKLWKVHCCMLQVLT